jgi:5-formyltetrahydrofolate cyclo-ligase
VRRGRARLGKGGGFSDLELAVAAEAGLVDRSTVVVTTVRDSAGTGLRGCAGES